MRRIVRFLFAVALVVAMFDAGLLKAAEMVSHRAEYRFFLGKNETSAGKSVEETRTDCKAWVQRARIHFHGSSLIPSNQRFEITEYRNGRGMDFLHHLSTGGMRLLNFEGSARKPASGKPGMVRYTSPEAKVMRLPPRTEFGTPFYLRVARELRATPNKVIRRTPVFGLVGGTATGLYYVEVHRAKHEEPLFSQVEGDTHLLDAPAIDLVIRMYVRANDDTPIYRIRMKLHANGVYSRAVYSKASGSITAEIARITELPKAKC